jgi:Protein of unknown function (DUF2934)
MPEFHDDKHQAIDKAAESEGHPEGREMAHWLRAGGGDEEKVLAGQADANIPVLLTKDVPSC